MLKQIGSYLFGKVTFKNNKTKVRIVVLFLFRYLDMLVVNSVMSFHILYIKRKF